jgi:predicted nucleotidyltransferase
MPAMDDANSLKKNLSDCLSKSLSNIPASEQLISVVQFGSTIRRDVLKTESDVDLLLIFESLPHRRDRHEIFESWEFSTQRSLSEFQKKGLSLHLSAQFKTREEAKQWSKIYLDMIYFHSILIDKDDFFLTILQKMKVWTQKNNACRLRMGDLWYWKYDATQQGKPVEFRFDSDSHCNSHFPDIPLV